MVINNINFGNTFSKKSQKNRKMRKIENSKNTEFYNSMDIVVRNK